MITAVTLNYRLPGHKPGDETPEATISVAQKTEGAAFDQAVEELKVQLIVATRVQAGESSSEYRDRIRAIVQLRPWAHSYAYLGDSIKHPTYYHGSK